MGTEPPSTLAERAIETIARSFDPVAWLPAYTTVCAARRDIARAKATRALDSLVTEFGLTVVRDTTYPKDPADAEGRTSLRIDGHRVVSDCEPLPDGKHFYDYDHTPPD
jgi:hypothetical protein